MEPRSKTTTERRKQKNVSEKLIQKGSCAAFSALIMLGAVAAAASLGEPCPGRYVVREERRRASPPPPAWLTDDWCTARCDTPAGCKYQAEGKAASNTTDLCGCGPCTSHAYFPEHKVVLCTVAKASSSAWRQFARRVHAVERGDLSVDGWCGTKREDFRGCLLDQSLSPAGVGSFEQLQRLVHEEGYTPAVFLRDPIERALSMYTGTMHAQGVDYHNTSFAQFVGQLEWGKFKGNEHMASQMGACNFGRSVKEAGIVWRFGASAPSALLDPAETTRRAHRFVAELFGEQMLSSVNANWTQCDARSTGDEFFAFDSQAKHEAGLAATGDLVPRIRALYADDARAYETAERQYDPAGPDIVSALVPLFVQTVPGRR